MWGWFPSLRQRRLRKLAARLPIPDPVWNGSVAGLALLAGLGEAELAQLREFATLFLRDKIFEPAGGMVLTEAHRVRIAVLASLPILGLDYDWYQGWRTVIVYPGQFVRPRSEFDAIGVMHEWEDVLTGESWEYGPVVLSWTDVDASGHREGYNVVIHEMAHKLDMRNGVPDGFPPLHRGMRRRDWTRVFTAAFEDFTDRVDAGEDTAIDPYAAEAPGEFFAVLSEYFFEQPGLLQAEYPAVYDFLAQFYRQDPAARLASGAP
jgi:Mlc titration factor MtfA (ptsG expression regulator)